MHSGINMVLKVKIKVLLNPKENFNILNRTITYEKE